MNIKNSYVKIKIKITRDYVVQLMWLTLRGKMYILLLAFMAEEEMGQKEENNLKTLEYWYTMVWTLTSTYRKITFNKSSINQQQVENKYKNRI